MRENPILNVHKQRIYPWTPLSEMQIGESDLHTVVIEKYEDKNER